MGLKLYEYANWSVLRSAIRLVVAQRDIWKWLALCQWSRLGFHGCIGYICKHIELDLDSKTSAVKWQQHWKHCRPSLHSPLVCIWIVVHILTKSYLRNCCHPAYQQTVFALFKCKSMEVLRVFFFFFLNMVKHCSWGTYSIL